MKELIKKIFKWVGIIFLTLIVGLLLLYLWGEITSQYNYNHKYSIAMPEIPGKFYISDDYIEIWGLNKIKNDEIANLLYTELKCIPSQKYCVENRLGVMGFGRGTSMFPYHYEYYIKYMDNDKILFEEDSDSFGEINLNAKTLTFTQKHAGINSNLTRELEVITDDKEIEKLEKKIIRKYLKKEWFK